MFGIIEKIRFYPEKGSAGIEMAEGSLIEKLGLEGDFHADGGDKQISLLVAGEREPLMKQEEKGFCFSRFKENIFIRGLTSDMFRPGVRFEAGEAVMEITGEIKYCHEECELYESGKRCRLAGRNLFARVVKSGVIRTGDRVNFVQ